MNPGSPKVARKETVDFMAWCFGRRLYNKRGDLVSIQPKLRRLLAGVASGGVIACAGPALADDEVLTWGYATAHVGTCVVGQTCGQPGGIRTLGRESSIETDGGESGASIFQGDYQDRAHRDFGSALGLAQAGEGLLGLPVLKAIATGGSILNQNGVITTSVNFSAAHAIQGYTNTAETALLIPLSAFRGLVDYISAGNPIGGRVAATLAVTTSAILNPLVSAEYFRPGIGASVGGQWTGNCDSTGALAFGSASVSPTSRPGVTQFLGLSATSCTGEETYLLNPGESFYVWATLGVLRSGPGVTDASNTFNVTIAPEFQAQVERDLAPALAAASGADLVINTGVIPEPSTWVMMITGFGAAGALLRRRRRLERVDA
jgi:PEP-CTERM motif